MGQLVSVSISIALLCFLALVPRPRCHALLACHMHHAALALVDDSNFLISSFIAASGSSFHVTSQPPGMDAHLRQEAKVVCRRLRAVLKKRKQRQRRPELPRKTQELLATLVLRSVPTDAIIGILRTVSVQLMPQGPRMLEELTGKVLSRQPALRENIWNNENDTTLRAQKLSFEWEVAMWLLGQSSKGLAVPSELLLERYRTRWPVGPHGPKVTRHLMSLGARKSRKKWLMRFRRRWNMTYSTLNSYGAMPTDEKLRKVKLFLTWVAYLGSIGFSMAQSLWLNMDETPLRFIQPSRKGNAYSHASHLPDARPRDISLRDRRTTVTLAAIVASQVDAQTLLPQVLLPNEEGRKRLWKTLPATLKTIWPNVEVIHNTGGWMNSNAMLTYIDRIHGVLGHAGYHKVVLLMDAARAHCTPAVFAKLADIGWKVCLIPSRLTYLLQPLDAYIFALFKQRVYVDHMEARCSARAGELSYSEWMHTCARSMRSYLQPIDAYTYFEKCGCHIPSMHISQRVSSVVAEVEMGRVRKLTMDELSFYVGTRTDSIYEHAFLTSVPEAAAAHSILVQRPAHRFRSKRSLASMSSDRII